MEFICVIVGLVSIFGCSWLAYYLGKSDGKMEMWHLLNMAMWKSKKRDDRLTPQERLDRMKVRAEMIDEFRYDIEVCGKKDVNA